MNFDDFSYEENGRRYIKPQINLDESNRFIDNLRGIQQTNNDQIRQDTYNLGTAVPSNLGGLVGGGSYFKSRFQTPQTNSLVADLRATAQATALQEAMSNELAKAKKRYSDAYRAAQKRANKASGSSSSGSGDSLQDILKKLGVDTKDNGASDKLRTEEIDWVKFWENPDSDLLSDVSVEELEEQLGYRRQALKGYTDAFNDSMQSYTGKGWASAWSKDALNEMRDNAEKYAQQIQLLQNELARR